jgi:hypothetical protein
MKTQILARMGMLDSELRTVRVLEESLPAHWKAYCGFELVLPKRETRECDMLIVADDRIIVTEIKEWNGEFITSDGKSWFTVRNNSISDARQHGIIQVTKTWKILTKRIKEKTNGRHLYIDKIVVQAGTASLERLPREEQDCVLNLEDMKCIGDKDIFDTYFKRVDIVRSRFSREQAIIDLDNLLANPSFAQGKKIHVFGYTASDNPILMSTGKGVLEYKGTRSIASKTIDALMRRWRFSSESMSQVIVTQKEREALLFNESNIQRLIRDELREYSFNTLHDVFVSDEAHDDAFQIFEIPSKYTRLGALVDSQIKVKKSDAIHAIKNIYSEIHRFHSAGIVVGDLTKHSFWLSPGYGVKISNLYHAYLINGSSHKPTTPSSATCFSLVQQDFNEVFIVGGGHFTKETDIILAGCIAASIIQKIDTLDNSGSKRLNHDQMSDELDLTAWTRRHRESFDSLPKFISIDEALDAFVSIVKTFTQNDDEEAIQQFLTSEIVWVKYPPLRTQQLPGGCTRIHASEGRIVDTWTNVKSGEGSSVNVKLCNFLRKTSSLSGLDIEALIAPVEAKFCKEINTLHLSYEFDPLLVDVKSESRGFEIIETLDNAKSFVIDLLSTIARLHQLNKSLGSLRCEMIFACKIDDDVRCRILGACCA